jgi:hypothetical protein
VEYKRLMEASTDQHVPCAWFRGTVLTDGEKQGCGR